MEETAMLNEQERIALREEAEQLWGEIRDAAYALTPEQIDRQNTVGTWSGRDVMIHIANWEEEATRKIRELERGLPWQPTYTTDAELDAWNEAHVAPWHDVPLADAKAYFERVHADLMELVMTSPVIGPQMVLGNYPGHLGDLLELAKT
jgi:hypothetical protein